jgi:hypothetical protein
MIGADLRLTTTRRHHVQPLLPLDYPHCRQLSGYRTPDRKPTSLLNLLVIATGEL